MLKEKYYPNREFSAQANIKNMCEYMTWWGGQKRIMKVFGTLLQKRR